MALKPMQNPNVKEENPGYPWNPKNGEIFIKSSIYDPEDGPFGDGAPAQLDDSTLLQVERVVNTAVTDRDGAIPEAAFKAATNLMSVFLSQDHAQSTTAGENPQLRADQSFPFSDTEVSGED